MSLQSEANDLYGVEPGEFTASRNSRAKEVRAGGDRELAERIRKLPKPRLVAWVLNMLARRLPDEVDQMVALGAAIRTAQASTDRDEARSLDDQRRQLTGALTQQARAIAADLGHPVNDPMAAEIENTLRAAMADPAGGAALRTGLLVDSFGTTGFEPVDISRVVAVPDAVAEQPESHPHLRVVRKPADTPKQKTPKKQPAKHDKPRPPKQRDDSAVRIRRQAREALDKARDAVAETERTLSRAAQSHADAVTQREQLESERAELQERLRAVDRELTGAHRAEDRARREQERAHQKYVSAQRAADRAARTAGSTPDD